MRDETRGLRTLGRGRRVDDHRGRGPVAIELGTRDGHHSGRAPDGVTQPGQRRRVVGLRECHRQLEGAVEAAAESLGQELVRLAGRLVGRVVAGVARGEAESEGGSGQGEHQRRGRHRGDRGASLHALDPAQPEPGPLGLSDGRRGLGDRRRGLGDRRRRLGSRPRAASPEPDRRPSARLADPPPDQAEQCGQQRERGEQHQHHTDRRGHRRAAEQAHPEGEHPEQRDHDRDSGKENGTARGIDRRLDRLLHIPAVAPEVLAEAGDDKQCVVDAHAEPDHQRQLGGEARHVDHVASERDNADPGAEAEQRRGDRKTHGGERPEADQQDHNRRSDSDDRREPERGLLRLLNGLAAQLDVERRRAGRFGGGDDAVDRRHRERVRALVEVDGGKADRPVAGDRLLAGGIGADHARHVRQTGDPRQHRLDRGAIGAARERPISGLKHDLVGVARLGGELALQQVDGLLRAGARQREAARGLLSDRARDREDPDHGDDPGHHDGSSVSHCPASDVDHFRPGFHKSQFCMSCIYIGSAVRKSTLIAKFPFMKVC